MMRLVLVFLVAATAFAEDKKQICQNWMAHMQYYTTGANGAAVGGKVIKDLPDISPNAIKFELNDNQFMKYQQNEKKIQEIKAKLEKIKAEREKVFKAAGAIGEVERMWLGLLGPLPGSKEARYSKRLAKLTEQNRVMIEGIGVKHGCIDEMMKIISAQNEAYNETIDRLEDGLAECQKNCPAKKVDEAKIESGNGKGGTGSSKTTTKSKGLDISEDVH